MNDFVELRQYIAIILRRWWILLLGAVIGAGLGYQISQRLPPVYRATGTLFVGQSIQSSSLDNRDIQTSEELAVTYAEIGQRQPVLEKTVDALDLNVSWQQLQKQVQFRPVEGTQLLEVMVEAGAPGEAEAIANEIQQQLILLSPTTAPQDQSNEESALFVQARMDSLQERIEAGQARIESLYGEMDEATTATELRELQDEINSLEGLMTDWENTYARLLNSVEDDTPVNNLAVIEEAHAGRTPIRPVVRLNTLLAAVAGLLLALIPVFTLEYLDNSIRPTDDLEQLLDVTPLGTVGKIKGKHYEEKLITSLDPFSPASEAYRMIRSSIRFMSEARPCRTILVTSASFGEGKSLTVANLGLAMAHAGNRTIIVDADLRRPIQHEIFGVDNRKGLTELLRSHELDFDGHVVETGVELLSLLPSGALPPNPSELLSSDYTELLLARLEEMADMIILDGPPSLSAADAALLSSQVDGVVLIVAAGRTERRGAQRTVSILEQAGANVLGVVLNRAPRSLGIGGYKPYGAALQQDKHSRAEDKNWLRRPAHRPAAHQAVVHDGAQDSAYKVAGNGQGHVRNKADWSE